jgi:hypothetical protein
MHEILQTPHGYDALPFLATESLEHALQLWSILPHLAMCLRTGGRVDFPTVLWVVFPRDERVY